MKFFDCDAAYGRGTLAIPREIETPEELVAELDSCGIEEALVWHRHTWERDFNAGNERLEELTLFPQLHPTMTFVPAFSNEMPAAEDFIRFMRAHDIRALRAFPAHHRYCLDKVSCGLLLELCIAYSIPLFVPLAEFAGQWQGVYGLLRDFSHLTLIVTASGCWGDDRYFRPLMKGCPRFFMSTNRLETAGQIKEIVDTLGAGRLLFGSGTPWNCPGGYIMMLTRAQIRDDAKEAIAHGNIERLLREVAW